MRPEDKSLIIACAAGAGLAAVYNSPLSAAIFTLETLLITWNVRAMSAALSLIHIYIADKEFLQSIFDGYKPDVVVNLAAQAGVRYSITNPDAYIESNIIGFYNILECCRHSYDNGAKGVEHLVYASSSSVYGSNKKIPYSTDDQVDNPVSLYAATKKSNELLAYSYAKLYNIPCTGLRFFTVYGPAGRPDMAYFGFTNTLRKGEVIKICLLYTSRCV